MLDLKDCTATHIIRKHKEEGSAKMKEGGKDRDNIRASLATCINPLIPSEHASEVVNIHSGKLSSKDVNVDKCLQLGKE